MPRDYPAPSGEGKVQVTCGLASASSSTRFSSDLPREMGHDNCPPPPGVCGCVGVCVGVAGGCIRNRRFRNIASSLSGLLGE